MQPFYFKSLIHPYSEETSSFQFQIQSNKSYAAVQLFLYQAKANTASVTRLHIVPC